MRYQVDRHTCLKTLLLPIQILWLFHGFEYDEQMRCSCTVLEVALGLGTYLRARELVSRNPGGSDTGLDRGLLCQVTRYNVVGEGATIRKRCGEEVGF